VLLKGGIEALFGKLWVIGSLPQFNSALFLETFGIIDV